MSISGTSASALSVCGTRRKGKPQDISGSLFVACRATIFPPKGCKAGWHFPVSHNTKTKGFLSLKYQQEAYKFYHKTGYICKVLGLWWRCCYALSSSESILHLLNKYKLNSHFIKLRLADNSAVLYACKCLLFYYCTILLLWKAAKDLSSSEGVLKIYKWTVINGRSAQTARNTLQTELHELET